MALKETANRTLLGRRDFLTRLSWASMAAAAMGAIGLSVKSLWPLPGQASSSLLEVAHPQEILVGGVSERLYGEHWIWVVRNQRGFYALSARCTHLGCRLRRAERQFQCMCHGSVFSLDGEVLTGPAARSLERVYIALNKDGRIVVDPSVRYRQEDGGWQHAGAFLSY